MSAAQSVQLTVLVPAYNEEQTIKAVLQKLIKQKDVFEIIVIDDCSKDNTSKIAKTIKDDRIRIIRHVKNQGKGKAIQTGLREAKGNYILIQDADLEYDPAEITTMLDPVKNGRAIVIYGSRFFGAHTNMFYWHFIGNKLLNFVVNILYDTTLSDMETCYKLLPTDIMRSLDLKENDFRIEPEITCKLIRAGHKIFEVPITYVGRTYDEGKKITWVDWFYAMETILKNRIS